MSDNQLGDDNATEAAPARNPGVNQRDRIRMTPEEVDAFLNGRRSMTMSTVSADGAIHSVAMWYGFLEGCVAFETKAKSQKVVNLRRDPRLTCLVEAGDYYEDLIGVTLIGRGEIVEHPERIFELGTSVFSRYVMPYTDELKPAVDAMLRNRVVVKLLVDKTVSWDHAKLGLPSTRPTTA